MKTLAAAIPLLLSFIPNIVVFASNERCSEDLITSLSNKQFSDISQLRPPENDQSASISTFEYRGLIGATGVTVSWVSQDEGSSTVFSTKLEDLPNPHQVQYKDNVQHGFLFDFPSTQNGKVIVIGFRPPEGGAAFYELEGYREGSPSSNISVSEWVGMTGGGAERATILVYYVVYDEERGLCTYFDEGPYEIDTVPKPFGEPGSHSVCNVCENNLFVSNPESIGVFLRQYGTEHACSDIIAAGEAGRIMEDDCNALSSGITSDLCCLETEPQDENESLAVRTGGPIYLMVGILLLLVGHS